ncbi:hypothetical protein NKR23_g12282 [Pleurostoma richardsiae]|uniref:Uncharacterized protein n=1 Tax=Pleurostoma richardsiae TaxID=41990 RepID=A0AA38R1L4_9PEZI|nr:hypothetical protein NKR23_g12282 [Pleurostoma richardsiae]
MERIRCCCKHCGFNLGELLNTWTQIGKSYYSPVLDPHVPLKVLVHGEVRTGDKQTLVGECDLQDIACASCYAIVGLQCIRTPLNHVLAEDQVLLRFTSVTFSTGEDGSSTILSHYLDSSPALGLRRPPR